MDQRLSLITLGVEDLERSRGFYEQLGWKAYDGPDKEVVFFQAVGIVIALWDRKRLADDSGVDDAGKSGGFTLAYNVNSPAEADTVSEEVRAAGGTITREPGETFWGGYSFAFTDPDGHPWEVAHNPYWTVTDDGRTLLDPE